YGGAILALKIVIIEGVAQLASVDSDGVITLWDRHGYEKARFHTGHAITRDESGGGRGWLNAACFAEVKGRTLVAAVAFDGIIKVFDLATQELVAEPIMELEDQTTTLALPGGDDLSLVSGRDDGLLKVWSVRFGAPRAVANSTDNHIR